MKTIIIIFLIGFSISAFPQVSINVSAGYNPKDISLSDETPPDGENAYWNNGLTFGINVGYFLSQNFLLSASYNCSHYGFDKYVNAGWFIPGDQIISSSGEDSEILRYSLEVKYFPFQKSNFRFFISSGLGYVIENIGEVSHTTYSALTNRETTFYFIRPTQEHLAHSLGLGCRSNVYSEIFIELSGFYYSNYQDWFQPLINLGLGYNVY